MAHRLGALGDFRSLVDERQRGPNANVVVRRMRLAGPLHPPSACFLAPEVNQSRRVRASESEGCRLFEGAIVCRLWFAPPGRIRRSARRTAKRGFCGAGGSLEDATKWRSLVRGAIVEPQPVPRSVYAPLAVSVTVPCPSAAAIPRLERHGAHLVRGSVLARLRRGSHPRIAATAGDGNPAIRPGRSRTRR